MDEFLHADVSPLEAFLGSDEGPDIVDMPSLIDEADGSIDEALDTNDMLTIISSEIMRKGVAGHHIESMNSFYDIGLKQIITTIFYSALEDNIKNKRSLTDEDKNITDIYFRVNFTDVVVQPPTITKYSSGKVEILTPNTARLNNLNYACVIYVNIDVKAVATLQNKTTKTRTAEIKNHRFAAIPCMVGSKMCHTSTASREVLKAYEEDPELSGGYFIMSGNEWCIINVENTTFNSYRVIKNMYKNEIVRGTLISKPGDAFENSYQIILKYLNTGAITIELTIVRDKLELPFYLIFKMMGMTQDKDIVNNIVYGVDNQDAITKEMLKILSKALSVEQADPRFGPLRDKTNVIEIIDIISMKIFAPDAQSAAHKDENIHRHLNNKLLTMLDKHIMPHIGAGPEFRIRKMRYLGYLINKLIKVQMGVIPQSDRDSYSTKRIDTAGLAMSKAFKTDFNFTTVQEIKKKLIDAFTKNTFSNIPLAEIVKTAIASDSLEKMINKSITTGDKVVKVKRNEVANRILSQNLQHKNDMNVKAVLNTISTKNAFDGRNERADEMRRVHPTYHGYIDITQSAESGMKVGLIKQKACTASVAPPGNSQVLKLIISQDKDIIPLDNVLPERITYEKLTKVLVNGDWVGCCKDTYGVLRKYRMMRRFEQIHPTTTIAMEYNLNEINFWVDNGRLVRPLVIVYNNLMEYITRRRAGDKDFKFKQWIKLTKNHIVKLQNKEITMDDLRRERVVDYIASEEQENTLIAPNINELRKVANDVTRPYSHCDIDQAIIGIVTLASPLSDHSSPIRTTYYTNHRKASATWYALNWPFRIDKNTVLQHYVERPMVSCISDNFTTPNGHNTIVALALYGAWNCEDSIIVNKSAVDRGLYNASFFTNEFSKLEKNEFFGNNDFARTHDFKRDVNYENIDNDGIVKENIMINKNDVIIVKHEIINNPTSDHTRNDKSHIYKANEPVYVERKVVSHNSDDVKFTKVKLRANRPLAIGDKLASRSGNKGIVSVRMTSGDLIYLENGVVPDLIVNAHSIPTRMAINQLMECVLAQLAAERGSLIDATTFRPIDIKAAIKDLESHGIEYGGHHRAFNGMTGQWMDTLIFIGPTTYQRIQKFVINDHYAIRSGPTSALTRQPLGGRKNDGGLKLGEMEKDCICAHGTMRALFEKFYKDSDGVNIPVCRGCGNIAVVNETNVKYNCKYCGDNADIGEVASSWVANLFFKEAAAMNVKMRFELEPHTYSKHE